MENQSLSVRTLTGTSYTCSVVPTDTVGTFRRHIQEQCNVDLTSCQLFLSGRKLEDRQSLGSLLVQPGCFIVAVPSVGGKPRRQVQSLKNREKEPAGTRSPGQQSPTAVAPGMRMGLHGQELDTLLPGYNIRPSPIKPKRPHAKEADFSISGNKTNSLTGPDSGALFPADMAGNKQIAVSSSLHAMTARSHDKDSGIHMGPAQTATHHSLPQEKQQHQQVTGQERQAKNEQSPKDVGKQDDDGLFVSLLSELAAAPKCSAASRAVASEQHNAYSACRAELTEAPSHDNNKSLTMAATSATPTDKGKASTDQIRGGRCGKRADDSFQHHAGSTAGGNMGQLDGHARLTRSRSRSATGVVHEAGDLPPAAATGEGIGAAQGLGEDSESRQQGGLQVPGQVQARTQRQRRKRHVQQGEEQLEPEVEEMQEPGPKATRRELRGKKGGAAAGGGGEEVQVSGPGGRQQKVQADAQQQALGCSQQQRLALLREQAAAVAQLPLPPALQRLQQAAALLPELHKFLLNHHVQPTWHAMSSLLSQHQGQHAWQLEDMRCMAALAPTMLAIRDRSQPHADELALPSTLTAAAVHAKPALHLEEDVHHEAAAAGAAAAASGGFLPASPVGTGSIQADLVGQGWSRSLAAQVAGAKLQGGVKDGGGSVLAGDVDSLVIDITDPGSLRVAANSSGDETRAGAAGPEAAHESSTSSLFSAAQQSRAFSLFHQRGAPGGSRAARCQAAFTRGAVAAVMHLQDQFLQQQQQQRQQLQRRQVQEEELQQQQRQWQQREEEQQPQEAVTSRAEGMLCGSENQAAAMPGATDAWQWDPLKKGCWHPLFQLQTITAKEAARAATQLQAQQQQQQQQAGPAAGGSPARLLGGDSCGRHKADAAQHQPAQLQQQQRQQQMNGAPRPPRMLKAHHGCCTSTQKLDTTQLLAHLKEVAWYRGQVVHEELLPARAARHAQPHASLGTAAQLALQARGASAMFVHQAQAIDCIMAGRHTVIATSTASGKSLCFQLPILSALEADPASTALLMFPTKALAQDQRGAMQQMLTAAFGPEAAAAVDTYDGDTTMSDREDIRSRCRLLITNPDMLHMSILPQHGQFAPLLANLKYVVLDEGHYYYGAFGAHTAMVMRRLRRLCMHYGSSPVFIVASATIANPQSHAQLLLGLPSVCLVEEDGSPHGAKSFVLWNPPLRYDMGPGAANGQQVKFHMTHTDSRKYRGPMQLALKSAARRELREATAARSRGSRLGAESGGLTQEQWSADVALALRKRRLQQEVFGKGFGARARKPGLKGASNEVTKEKETEEEEEEEQEVGLFETQQLQQQQQRVDPLQPCQTQGTDNQQQQEQQQHRGRSSEAEALLAQAAQQALAAVTSCGSAAPPAQQLPPRQADAGVWLLTSSGYKKLPRHGTCTAEGSSRAAAGNCSSNNSRLQQLRAEVLQRLPSPGEWRQPQALGGAAGLPLDQQRDSPIVEISLLLAECMQHGLRTIAFCTTRKLCELVAAYTRETLKTCAPHLAGAFKVYRGGYSPVERRAVEADLFSGQLLGVAATNALELGVDVGSLDVTLHLGFQGSMASLRQQSGRAGRREQQSLAIYVAFDGPLDQHFMKHPEDLFGRPIESAQLDPSNAAILEQHVQCAAAELPLMPAGSDALLFGPQLQHAVSALRAQGLLGRHPHGAPSSLHYTGHVENVARGITLRSIDPEHFAILDEGTGTVLEQIEARTAFYHIYDGAVYLHQGRTYLCKRLDLGERVAVVRAADVKYYTKMRDHKDVHITGGRIAYPSPPAGTCCPKTSAMCETAAVTVRFMGFHRVWQRSGEVFDSVDLHLPDFMFETQAAYLRVPPAARQECMDKGLEYRAALHAASHAMLNILPLLLLCNPRDVGTECDNPYDTRFRVERLLLYDKQHAGGVGLSAQATALFPLLLEHALQLVSGCGCLYPKGCPRCIHHVDCSNYNAVLCKAGAEVVLRHVLQSERAYAQQQERQQQQQQGAAQGFHQVFTQGASAEEEEHLMNNAMM